MTFRFGSSRSSPSSPFAADAQPVRKPVALFDGRTFQGWEGDTAKTWRIEDGSLAAR